VYAPELASPSPWNYLRGDLTFFSQRINSLSTHLGSGKKDKKYMGMADKTILIIVILPPSETLYSANFLCIISTSGLHCGLLSLPIVSVILSR